MIKTKDGIHVYCAHTELKDPAGLVPNPQNPNTHPESQVELLARIIKAQGWRASITVSDRSGFIVRGHGRLMAANRLNLTEVPIDIQHYDTEAEEYADLVADNRLSELSMMDNEVLYGILEGLKKDGFDLELSGYMEDELDKVRAEHFTEVDGNTDPDDIPDMEQKDTFVLPGDLWTMGKHKILCGDSTNQKDLDRLIGKEKIGMIFCDPPYNVDYKPEERPRNAPNKQNYKTGGIMQDDGSFETINWLDAITPYMKQCAFYICSGDKEAPLIHNWILTKTKGREPTYIVWAKNSFTLTRRDYHRQHEFIIYSWIKDKHWAGSRSESDLWWWDKAIIEGLGKEELVKLFKDMMDETDIWDVHRDPVQEYVHPTQKPVALAKKAMRHSSKPDDIVVDFFGGSGSTLIAGVQMDRRAYLMELDPYYVSVGLLRYLKFTGDMPIREDGKTLEEVMQEGKASG